jgi:hypothetical protein
MRNYIVYFEIYGKKMKTTVMAHSQQDAVEIVKGKIQINKVELLSDEFNAFMNLVDIITKQP